MRPHPTTPMARDRLHAHLSKYPPGTAINVTAEARAIGMPPGTAGLAAATLRREGRFPWATTLGAPCGCRLRRPTPAPQPPPRRGLASESAVLRAAARLAGQPGVTLRRLAVESGLSLACVRGVVDRLEARSGWPHPFPVAAPRPALPPLLAPAVDMRPGRRPRALASLPPAPHLIHPEASRPAVGREEARAACEELLAAWRRGPRALARAAFAARGG